MCRFDARKAVRKRLEDLKLYKGKEDNPMVVPVCRWVVFSLQSYPNLLDFYKFHYIFFIHVQLDPELYLVMFTCESFYLV